MALNNAGQMKGAPVHKSHGRSVEEKWGYLPTERQVEMAAEANDPLAAM